ncbi:MAG: beta-ketoacyl synthase chain length factor [Flavobacteriales bacterium]|nr:beta-ketoacyl synthase chain length factor [Flavobacteriales bacterium]
MMYLGAASCISFQDTFGRENPWSVLTEVNAESQLVQPDYKEFVSPAMLRRMSSALKMGVAGGKSCLQKAGLETCDAITVGTGLGCVRDTLKFMKTMYEEAETGLSPTSFIQSTHNSIAGQIALLLGNHGYNMTHVQGGLSLGYALSDGELLIGEGDADTVLVGAVDEKTEELVELLTKLAATANYDLPTIGEGGAFFLASKEKLSSSVAKVVELSLINDPSGLRPPPLSRGGTGVLNQGQSEEKLPSLEGGVGGGHVDLVLSNTGEGFNYVKYSGEHFTSVGFGLFMALKAFEAGTVKVNGTSVEPKSILVRHSLFGQEFSILLEKV